MDESQNMPISTTYIAIIFKNLLYLLSLAFGLAVNFLITIFPDWKVILENIKIIGGAIIVILVIIKLLLEIIKLRKQK